MKTGMEEPPTTISEYTYYLFSEIEKRGLQFALPPAWKPLYIAYLKEKKRIKILRDLFIVLAGEGHFETDKDGYNKDFGKIT